MKNLIGMFAMCCFLVPGILQSCKKEDPDVLPLISTSPVDFIARTAAGFSATIINEGSDSITDKGFCWSLEVEPDLADQSENKVFFDDGHMETLMHGLSPSTTYYVRAYAINSAGISYGNEVSFTTKSADAMTLFNPDLSYGSVQDIEGNSYKTIVIGEQEWMAENLKATSYNDGTAIPLITLDPTIYAPLTPGYSWYDNNETIFKDIYGAHYNWLVVNTSKLCPSGWHVPTDEEWKVLEVHLGMPRADTDNIGTRGSTEGNELKESGTYNWVEESEPGSNLSGFTALPGGTGSYQGEFRGDGYFSIWWTSTGFDPGPDHYYILCRWLLGSSSRISRTEISKTSHLNVRCVKD